MNNSIRHLTIFLTVFILVGCGPSAEEIKEQEKQATLAQWTFAENMFKTMKENEDTKSMLQDVEMYITSDGKGIVFRESQYEMIGLIGFQIFYPELGIPDYIIERISNTAPIDGNQKDSYDNVEINWSINRTSLASISTLKIYINLRLVD